MANSINKRLSRKSSKRPSMRKQPINERIRNFKEVALGLTEEQAIAEAERCLQCTDPKCVEGCPVEIDIPSFIKNIKEEKFDQAIKIIKERDNLPGITGRVCPQETQCETLCVLEKVREPIAIGALERFAADFELRKGMKIPRHATNPVGKKVAVIGSGPAGLTVAGDLARLGYKATIYEALHKSGGVLIYGIPEFRLPKKIVNTEVEYIKKLGVEIKTNMVIGKTLTINEFFALGYDAVFIGGGAGSPHFLDIEGENLGGVYSANEFLTRCNLMKAYLFPEYDTPICIGRKVVVVGGGNVAMDAARVALRTGADVCIVYRRSEKEMPARAEEIKNAKEEGIQFRTLTNPVRILGNGNGHVNAIECVRMKLGAPDESGRRRPMTVRGSNLLIDADTMVIAIGQDPNPLISQNIEGLKTNKKKYIIVDETGRTSIKGVWAGGDIAPGEGTVIAAMGDGRRTAIDIHKCLSKNIKGCTTRALKKSVRCDK